MQLKGQLVRHLKIVDHVLGPPHFLWLYSAEMEQGI